MTKVIVGWVMFVLFAAIDATAAWLILGSTFPALHWSQWFGMAIVVIGAVRSANLLDTLED